MRVSLCQLLRAEECVAELQQLQPEIVSACGFVRQQNRRDSRRGANMNKCHAFSMRIILVVGELESLQPAHGPSVAVVVLLPGIDAFLLRRPAYAERWQEFIVWHQLLRGMTIHDGIRLAWMVSDSVLLRQLRIRMAPITWSRTAK